MAILNLKISIAADALPVIDRLRDGMGRDWFLRRALEIGLCQIMADASHTNNDKIMHQLRGNTTDWRMVRGFLFSVDDPENATPEKPQG